MLLEGEYKNSHVNLMYNAKAKENSLGCLYFGTCSMETMEEGGEGNLYNQWSWIYKNYTPGTGGRGLALKWWKLNNKSV